ncbi:cysteine desulfurase NifS [bacterium Unc6]|nr:cysteine desulfurase NifS [bacterium Unc6]
MKRIVYLDNNATTPVDPLVLEAMLPYYKQEYGNASGIYSKGQSAKIAIEKARTVIGEALGTEPVDIIFVSGGTEADNFAIKGVAYSYQNKGRHIITTKVEHSAVLKTCQYLEKNGFSVTYLDVDKTGLVSPEDVKNAITDRTILATVMHSNNEVGTVQPIQAIADICKEKGVLFHTDAVQSFGKIPLDVEKMGVDLLSLSAHKIYGPKGIGILYVRKKVDLIPMMHGGPHERKLRAGTENVPLIVGFGKAVEIAVKNMSEEPDRIRNLRDMLHQGLLSSLTHLHLNGHPTQRLPGVLNIGFEYVEGESIILNFDMKGICASTGSACTSGSLEPSHVLTAMGVDPVISQGSVRFSVGRMNTEKDIKYCIKVIPPIIKRLREMSPLS